MSGVATAVVAGTVVGGYLQGQSAKSAASTSADAQRYAADQAAAAAKFTPYGVTTGFGSSNFGTDENGNPTASYTLIPQLQTVRNRMIEQSAAYDPTRLLNAAEPLYGAANTAFGGGQNLFGLGSQYLAQSPEQARQDYMRNQQALFAPQDEQQLAALRNQQFQTGRTGLATGGTTAGGMQATNPEMAAYYNSITNRNLGLAANAETAAQQRQAFGATLQNQGIGMYGTGAGLLGQIPALATAGYGPLQTQLGIAGQIEGYGQNALDIGAQLGGRSATAGANVGQALLTGGISAAKTAQVGNAYNPFASTLQGIGNSPALNSWFQNSLNQTPKTGQTTNWYGGVVNDPTYGAGTAYSNMTPGEISNMQQYGL